MVGASNGASAGYTSGWGGDVPIQSIDVLPVVGTPDLLFIYNAHPD